MPVTPRHNQFYTIRREFRKPYMIDDSYQEMMATTWSKSVWNQILEIDPQWAEFLFTRADLPDAATAAEIRYLRYIRQSEFKKAYGDYDYPEMEYRWEGFIPTWDFDWNLDWDFPWRPREGGGVWGEPGEGGPWATGCFAMSDGCYCPGQTADVLIEGNLPITGISFVHNQGETITSYNGTDYTNDLTVSINSPSTRTGQMRINVNMYDPSTGAPCVSTINIYPCAEEDCCPDCDDSDLAWDWDNSDETIGALPGSATVVIVGGVGPFTWSLTQEGPAGGNWTIAFATTDARTNTVNASVGACGSATITVTDACGCTTTGSVRYTGSGSWQNYSTCAVPAAEPCIFSDGVFAIGGPGSQIANYTVTKGKWEQKEEIRILAFGGSYAHTEAGLAACTADLATNLSNCVNVVCKTNPACCGDDTLACSGCTPRPNPWFEEVQVCLPNPTWYSKVLVQPTAYVAGGGGCIDCGSSYRRNGNCICTTGGYSVKEWKC